MPMPMNFIIVRHGESEGNVANRLSRREDNSRINNKEFKERHNSQWRLSEMGKFQASWAGDQIRSFGLDIGRKYTSPYLRAMQTMGLMELGGPNTMAVYEIRERSWGDLDGMSHEERMQVYGAKMLGKDKDPFLWEPPGGESLVGRVNDVKDWLGTVHRECGSMDCVVVSCHAETMSVIRSVLERILPEDFKVMLSDETQQIWNCGILHYTRINPFKQKLGPSPYLNWVRLLTPLDAHQHGAIGFDWKQINRPTFTDEDLLNHVDNHAPEINYD